MNKLIPLLLLALGLALTGCETTQPRVTISEPSLAGIDGKVASAQTKINTVRKEVKPAQAETLGSAVNDLAAARVEIGEKQEQIGVLTKQVNAVNARLNYLEPKYNDAVRLLWKWRGFTIAAFFVGAIAGAILMAIFRLWLKANIPIIGGLIP